MKKTRIYCHQTRKFYNGPRTAGIELKISQEDIKAQLARKIKHVKNYTFSYREVEPKKRTYFAKRPDMRVRVKAKKDGKIYSSYQAAVKTTGLNRNHFEPVTEGNKKALSIAVRCVQTGQLFKSLSHAAVFAGVTSKEMSRHMQGLREHCNGYTFLRLTDPFKIESKAYVQPETRWRHIATGQTFKRAQHAANAFGISEKSVRRGGTEEHRFEQYEEIPNDLFG